MNRIITGCVFLMLTCQTYAQEQRVFSQFFMNPYIYNPAYAGVEGHSALFVMYRAQYTGIQGGPTFAHAAFHTPLENGLGIGGMVFNEEEGGLLKTSGFKVSGSYLVPFDKKHYLRFGMSLGAGTTTLDNSDPVIADISADPAFSNLSNKHMIADFGVTYYFNHFNLGLSIPNLVSREVISSESFSPIKISPLGNVMVKMNYRGHINHDFALEPHLIYRYSDVYTNQYEAAVIAHLKHVVWVGASYREGAGLNALVGFKVKDKLGIGYSFDMGNSNISSVTGATHEVHIGYHIGANKQHHRHRQSFIKSHSLTPEERAQLAENRRLEKENKEQESLASLNEKQTTEPENNEAAKARDDENESNDRREELGQNAQDTRGENKEEIGEENKADDKAGRDGNDDIENSKPGTRASPDTTQGAPPVITKPRGSTTVKRGSHILELPEGYHVIAGAFAEFEHAENYSDKLFDRGFYDTIVGYQSAKGYYYVVLNRFDNYDTALKQRNKVRQSPDLRDVWVLTVE